MNGELSVLFYTMANLNIIDGSSIWMHSVAETLHVDSRLRITIPLRAPEHRDVVTRGLRRLPRVELLDPRHLGRPDPGGMNVFEAISALERADAKRRHDIVLLRAYELCREAVRRGLFAGRLWSCYILEPERDISDPEYLAGMTRIAEASRHVVCQSEEMRALLESLVPAAIGKTIILAPGIPEETVVARPDPGRIVPRMIYAGKFHRFYPVDRMIDAFQELRTEHPDLEFHVAGDKFHRPRGDTGYAVALERALVETPGLVWHGGIGRDEVEALLAEGGVALSLWDFRHGPGMNNLVISTKLLDFCSVGLPVILNRTAAQEDVLGADYPLFVNRVDEALPLLRRLFVDAALYRLASERSFEASRRFTYPSVYAALAPYVDRVMDELAGPAARRLPVSVVSDGPSEVEALIGAMAGFDVRRSNVAAGAAGPVVVEGVSHEPEAGLGPGSTGSRRILRLARSGASASELAGFDRVIAADDALAAAAVTAGIDAARVAIIPTAVDDAQLARPKLPGAMFNVAVAGLPSPSQLPSLARFVACLRAADERFRVVIRAAPAGPAIPGDDPGITWEPDDGDPASWYRTVGFIVAVDPESSQVHGIWQAMAAATVPVLIDQAGAAGWILGESSALSPEDAAGLIVRMVHGRTRDAASRQAAELARATFGIAAVRAAWIGELA